MIPSIHDMKPVGFFAVAYPHMTPYGFTWGPIEVERIAHYRPRKDREAYILKVNNLEICVSRTGRSVRVFRDGVELK